jgi:hypothetical protein
VTTLSELLKVRAAGYTGGPRVTAGSSSASCSAHAGGQLDEHHLRRLEGASADDAPRPLTCPSCGTKGTLVLTYGPEASPTDSDVLRELSD